MNHISGRLIDSLKTLGLTDYEARVYSAIVHMDRAEVKEIYEFLGASKPNVYQSLKSLSDKGLVLTISSRPVMYKAVPYESALKHMMEAHKRAEEMAREEFAILEKHRRVVEPPEVLWTLFGDKNIAHKLEEMLSGAKRSVKGIIPSNGVGLLSHLKDKQVFADILIIGKAGKASDVIKKYDLTDARIKEIKKGTGMTKIMMDEDFAEFHKMLSDDVLMFIIDDSEFIYLLPNSGGTRTGITSKNPSMIRMAGFIFNTAWKRC